MNITGYQYSTSINDTATKVKLRRQKDNKTYTATASDSSGISKYGVLQYVETVSDNINQAQLQERAKVKQAQKKVLKRTQEYSSDWHSGSSERVAHLYLNSGSRG